MTKLSSTPDTFIYENAHCRVTQRNYYAQVGRFGGLQTGYNVWVDDTAVGVLIPTLEDAQRMCDFYASEGE